LPLLNIYFPPNAQTLFSLLQQVFNFQLIDSDKVFEKLMPVFLIQENQIVNETLNIAFNEQFYLNGYTTISSVLNLGSTFFYFVAILIIYAVFLAILGILKIA
jgi:hypothetical protein